MKEQKENAPDEMPWYSPFLHNGRKLMWKGVLKTYKKPMKTPFLTLRLEKKVILV